MEIKVGIFWVIKGKFFAKVEGKRLEEEQGVGRAALTGFIDSDLGHYECWEKLCGIRYPNADFSTFPRGRVMYDVNKKEHLIYADRCIGREIVEIAKLYNAERYRVEREEHYRCDKCMQEEDND